MAIMSKSIRGLLSGLFRVKKTTVILFGILACVLMVQIAGRTMSWSVVEGFERESTEERKERLANERLDEQTATVNDIIDSFYTESAELSREREVQRLKDEIEKIPLVDERLDNVARLLEFDEDIKYKHKVGILSRLVEALKIDDFKSDDGKRALDRLRNNLFFANAVDGQVFKNTVLSAYNGDASAPAEAVTSAASGAKDSIMSFF
jgi:cell division protein FtsI/penicillin-binding protein 2